MAGLVLTPYFIRASVLGTPGARLLKWERPFDGVPPPLSHRGAIVGRSAKSKMRFRECVESMPVWNVPEVGLLSYPSEFPGDPKAWKKHLDRWSVRVEREFPGLHLFWVIEPQERGAPHYHLLIYGLWKFGLSAHGERRGLKRASWQVRQAFQRWVSQAWYEVVGSGDLKHLRTGTSVRAVRSQGGVASYMAGYLTKHEVAWEGVAVGRRWGQKGRKHSAQVRAVRVESLHVSHAAVERTARRLRHSQAKIPFHRSLRRLEAARRAGKDTSGIRLAFKPKRCWSKTFTLFSPVDSFLGRAAEIVQGHHWHREDAAVSSGRAAPKRNCLSSGGHVVGPGAAWGKPLVETKAPPPSTTLLAPLPRREGPGVGRLWSAGGWVPVGTQQKPRWKPIGDDLSVSSSSSGVRTAL